MSQTDTKTPDKTENQLVQLTSKAISQVNTLLQRDSKDPNMFALRLAIKGGGCSGLSYSLDFDEIQNTDLVQDFSAEDQKIVKVCIDPKSFVYLKGMTIDFEDGLMGKGFVFKNPNASDTCGCGESFSAF